MTIDKDFFEFVLQIFSAFFALGLTCGLVSLAFGE